MDRGLCQATVHGVAKSQTQLSNFHYYYDDEYTEKEEINLKNVIVVVVV